MKEYLLLLLVCLFSCQSSSNRMESSDWSTKEQSMIVYTIPQVEVAYETLTMHRQGGIWTLEGNLYSGYAIETYPNGQIKSTTGFVKGKRQGDKREYYMDGHLKQITPYQQNLIHGEAKNWFGIEGHPVLAIRNYHLGKPHGIHKKWYKSGQLFKIMCYDMGKEEGMQQAFNENGSVYANYEARNGRSFGLKRSMLCVELSNENIQYYEAK